MTVFEQKRKTFFYLPNFKSSGTYRDCDYEYFFQLCLNTCSRLFSSHVYAQEPRFSLKWPPCMAHCTKVSEVCILSVGLSSPKLRIFFLLQKSSCATARPRVCQQHPSLCFAAKEYTLHCVPCLWEHTNACVCEHGTVRTNEFFYCFWECVNLVAWRCV